METTWRTLQGVSRVHCLILGLLCFTLVQSSGFAWYEENHQAITRLGIQLLPESERTLLGLAADSLIAEYCMFPDKYRSAVHDADEARIQQYRPYVDLPLLQDLGALHNNQDGDSEVGFYIAVTLMDAAVRNLRNGNVDEAARYMGSLVHFIEDNACPVHVVDNKLLAELLPVPERLQPFRLHRRVEEPTFDLSVSGYEVKLLGATIGGAAEVLYQRSLENRMIARAQAVPVLRAIYADDKEAADRGRARAAIAAVKLVADALHTICTLAEKALN